MSLEWNSEHGNILVDCLNGVGFRTLGGFTFQFRWSLFLNNVSYGFENVFLSQKNKKKTKNTALKNV